MRQKLQRHILERAGRPVPQFENVEPGSKLDQRRRIFLVERAGIGSVDAAGDFVGGEIGQVESEHFAGARLVVHSDHPVDLLCGNFREFTWDKESAILGESSGDRLSGGDVLPASGAGEMHDAMLHPFL